MCKEFVPTLLVVLPGAQGRRPVLERLQSFARICVLVSSEELKRSSWAREPVGDDFWIELDGTASDFENAWSAVQEWMQRDPENRIHGIMSYDEFGLELCSFLGERLDVPCTPVDEIRCMRNKQLFRERCRSLGVPVVRNVRLHTDADLQELLSNRETSMRFPCVLKPVKGAGSWHVLKVDNPEELRREFTELSNKLANSTFPQEIKDAGFTLEEYFQGHEVDVDGWARNGKVEFCMVNDNRPALEPYFVELGGFYPSQLPAPAIAVLEQLTAQVVAAFPGTHCCFHFEAKIDVDTLEVMPIEFNARCGGAECPASVEAVSGYYLPEVAARLALELSIPPPIPKYPVVASTNIHVLERGIIQECTDKEVDITACNLVTSAMFGVEGQPHMPNNGSASCLGFMAAGGCTADEAERKLQKAIRQTRISVTPFDKLILDA